MYFLVGVYIGGMIVEKLFPLRVEGKENKRKRVNALKTPEFVLIVLTV